MGPKEFFLKYLLASLFTYSTQSLCKISKNCLEWILRTSCTSFMTQFRVNISHFEANRIFLKIFTIVALIYLHCSTIIYNFKKIIKAEFKKRANQFFGTEIIWRWPLLGTGSFSKNWAATLFSKHNNTTVKILKELCLFLKISEERAYVKINDISRNR